MYNEEIKFVVFSKEGYTRIEKKNKCRYIFLTSLKTVSQNQFQSITILTMCAVSTLLYIGQISL